MPIYTSPTGSVVLLEFINQPYTVPLGSVVAMEFGPDDLGASPLSIDDSAFGVTSIYNLRQVIELSGFEGVVGTPSLTLDLYIVPLGSSVPMSFGYDYGAASFTEDLGSTVLLRFGRPPSNTTIEITGWDSAGYGSAAIANRNQTLTFTGFGDGAVGSLSVFQPVEVALTGFDASAYGTHVILNQDREILFGAIPTSFAVPNPQIELADRTLTITGMAATAFPTIHIIHHFVQYLTTYGTSFGGYGSPTIEFKSRTFEIPFIATGLYGRPTIGFHQTISLTGFSSGGVVSETFDVLDNTQYLACVPSDNPPALGENWISNYVRTLFVAEEPSVILVAVPLIYNEDQSVTAGSYADNSPLLQFGLPYIENRNREMVTFGRDTLFFGYHRIYNNADPVFAGGYDFSEFGTTDVSHQHRTLLVGTWQSSFLPDFNQLYNDARVLSAPGIASVAAIGAADILNADRTFEVEPVRSSNAFGTGFIAYAIRTIAQYNSAEAPTFAGPEIRLDPFPISPAGILSYQGGGPFYIEERFNILYVQPTNVFSTPRQGFPTIENRNRTIFTPGRDDGYTEYGRPTIYNLIRTLDASGHLDEVFGSAVIADRTQSIQQSPTSRPVFSVTHSIRNVNPDPPSQQTVVMTGFTISNISNGHAVRLNVIYATSIDDGAFGEPTIRSTGIFPRGVFEDTKFGEHRLSGTQFLFAKPTPNSLTQGESDLHTSIHRVDPHTIYAPASDTATAQAAQNNGSQGHRIDEYDLVGGAPVSSGWPWFGTARISNYYRSFEVQGRESDIRFGQAALELRNRKIFFQGIRSLRMGSHVFQNVDQFLYLDRENDGIASSNVVPNPTIYDPNPPLTQYISAIGDDLSDIGEHACDLLHRSIGLTGIPHRGTPPITNPWGEPYIGETPLRPELQGFVASLWGLPIIEYKNREFAIQGFEDSKIEPDPFNFRLRMRVIRLNPNTPIQGFESAEYGVPALTHGVRELSVNGFQDDEIGYHGIRGSNTVAPDGIFEEVFGDVNQVVPGTITPYAPDYAVVSRPQIHRGMHAIGFEDSVIGEASVGRVIYLYGFPPVGFDGPVLTDVNGCNNRTIVPLSIQSTTVIGVPSF